MPPEKKLRLLYVDGPGNVAGTFRQWISGSEDPSEVSRTFSGDVFDLIRDLKLDACVIATHPGPQRLQHGSIIVEHRPVPSRGASGLAFHLGELRHAVWLLRLALRFRADAVIVADQLHWFALWPLHLLHRKLIVMLHCAFWPRGFRSGAPGTRRLQQLNGRFWPNGVDVTLCVSPEVERQLRAIAGPLSGPVLQVRAQYRRAFFAAIPPPAYRPDQPFRVLFAGRIERAKGVFDLLEIAIHLARSSPGAFTFELCGEGSAQEELAHQIAHQTAARGLAGSFRLLGKLGSEAMAQAFGRCHAVIVPTGTGFTEGMNRVAIEGVLAGRPVITSPAAHAEDVLGDALVIVPVGDRDAYAAALQKLRSDPAFYAERCAATRAGTEVFFDGRQSFRATLELALKHCFPGRL